MFQDAGKEEKEGNFMTININLFSSLLCNFARNLFLLDI